MKAYFLIFLFQIIFIVTSNAQSDKTLKDNSFDLISLALNINFGNSFFHNSPFVFDNCPNCYRENQREELVADFNILSELNLSKKQDFLIGFGISQFAFKEDHFTFDSILFQESPSFEFYSIRFGHKYDLWKHGRIKLSLRNMLSTDVYAKGHLWLIKRINFSYIVSPEIELSIYKRLAFSIKPFFRQSFINYNRVVFDKNYWPYSYGLGVGIKYLFYQKN